MSIIPAGKKIVCRVDVPKAFASKARYALEALLIPLGLEPVWSGPARIVYADTIREHVEGKIPSAIGDAPAGKVQAPSPGVSAAAEGSGAVHLDFSPAAPRFFEGRRPYDRSEASYFSYDREQWPALFTSVSGRPDLVASAFLFLSGWHEAASERRDEHGRVPYEATLPHVFDTPERPVVDVYRQILAEQLAGAGIELKPRSWNGRDWVLIPTHDVDYMRKWRPGILYREVVQDLVLNRRGATVGQRMRRIRGVGRQFAAGDPYRRAFTRMMDEVNERGGSSTYFLKGGAGDPHDVAYSLNGRFIRSRLVSLQASGFEVGLHPSYRAVDRPDKLHDERHRVDAVTSSELISIRQHYLRYDPARTPRLQREAGFEIDSTLGFADRIGFRRATCLPYRLYDLEGDTPLDIWEMPLILMESALFRRQNLDLEDAVAATKSIIKTCRRFRGACVALWHNTLWDEIDCPGWGEHFIRTLDTGVRQNALISSLERALRGWH